MRRVMIPLALLLLVGCQSLVNDYVDSYLDAKEATAIEAAKLAADDVGVPLDLYADLWNTDADGAERLRLAGILIADLVRNNVDIEDTVHVSISVAVMLALKYRPPADE